MHIFFFSSRRRHTRYWRDWSSDVCSSDLCASPLKTRSRPAPAADTTGSERQHAFGLGSLEAAMLPCPAWPGSHSPLRAVLVHVAEVVLAVEFSASARTTPSGATFRAASVIGRRASLSHCKDPSTPLVPAEPGVLCRPRSTTLATCAKASVRHRNCACAGRIEGTYRTRSQPSCIHGHSRCCLLFRLSTARLGQVTDRLV